MNLGRLVDNDIAFHVGTLWRKDGWVGFGEQIQIEFVAVDWRTGLII